MNNFFQHVKTAQGLYPRLFAEETKLPWGSLFYNPRNTLSIEANHAVVLDPQEDYGCVLQQAKSFYKKKGLPTRVYFYLNESEETALQNTAKIAVGTLTKSPLKLLVCRDPKEKNVSTPLQFDHLTEWDKGINEHIIGENLHLEGILRGSMAHDTYTLTVGYLFGTPVTMAGIWDDGEVMRISNVMTGDAFRGCGFAGALILHQLSLAAKAGKPVYLFADNPVAIRVYERDGMQIESPDFALYIFEGN